MRSKNKQKYNFGIQHESTKKSVLRLIADDISKYFRPLLAVYVVSMLISPFWRNFRYMFYWPAFHGVVALATVAALVSAAYRVAERSAPLVGVNAALFFGQRLLQDFFANILGNAADLRKVRIWQRWDYLKVAITVALLLCASVLGADSLSMLALAFGCSSVLFRAFSEKVPYVLAAFFIALLPLLQAHVSQYSFTLFSALAFDVLTVAILSSFARLFSTGKSSI